MLLDKQNMLSDQQSLAVAPGSVLSTNTLDLRAPQTTVAFGAPISDVGRGKPPQLLAQVTEGFASGGAGTLQVQLVTADDAALSVNLTVRTETPVLALAALGLGRQFPININPGITQRYLGLRYIVGTAAMTTGKVSAGLAVDKQTTYV